MKNLFLITFVVGNLMTPAANAALRTDVPKTKLTLTEAQINAIKNERGRPAKESSTIFFDEDNDEQLEELLQARLREVDNIVRFRDHTSLDRVLTFSGLAFQAWNPELRHTDTKTMIVKNIINYGFIEGFVVPTMAMMDASYAIGHEGFGNLMNAMLSEIAPNIAENFKKQYGVPTEVNGQNFDQISNHGRQRMWVALMGQLDPDFYKVHNETEILLIDGRLKAKSDNNDLSVNDFINVNINGDKTAIRNYLKKIGKEDNSSQLAGKRRLFSSELGDRVDATQCAVKCLKEVLSGAAEGDAGGKAVGKIAGKGSKALARVTAVLGAANGVDKCIASTECGGSKEQRAEEKRKKEEAEKAAAAEKQKYIDQYNDMIKEESKKKLQEDLKNEEKRKELEKRRQEYEKTKNEPQPNNDNSDDTEQEEKSKWEDNRDERPMITDEEKAHLSKEDLQKKKDMASMPMVPDEVNTKPIVMTDRLDLVVKRITTEKTTDTIKVNAIYPTNPNIGN